MSIISTIELENDKGRRIIVNAYQTLEYAAMGWHEIETVDDKSMETADELEAEKVAGDEEIIEETTDNEKDFIEEIDDQEEIDD